MPLRPCLTCGKRTNGSYCPRHRKRRSPARGSGGKAATFRRRTLALTGGKCAICGSTDRVQAHHIYGLGRPEGTALCHVHHLAAERAARARTRTKK